MQVAGDQLPIANQLNVIRFKALMSIILLVSLRHSRDCVAHKLNVVIPQLQNTGGEAPIG
jgi:hypothetical protein